MSTTDQSPRPKLHWLRYKLKTLLDVMLLMTVAFGGWVDIRPNNLPAASTGGGTVLPDHRE